MCVRRGGITKVCKELLFFQIMYNLLPAGETHIQGEMETQLKAQCFTPTGTGAADQQQQDATCNNSRLTLKPKKSQQSGFKMSGGTIREGQPHLDEFDIPEALMAGVRGSTSVTLSVPAQHHQISGGRCGACNPL